MALNLHHEEAFILTSQNFAFVEQQASNSQSNVRECDYLKLFMSLFIFGHKSTLYR